MKDREKIIQDTNNFGKIFYRGAIVFLIILVLAFVFLSFRLNEEFFRKYSEDKRLEPNTLNKIHSLQTGLLIAAIIFSVFVFSLVYFEKQVKLFIQKYKLLLQNLLLLLFVLLLIFLFLEGMARIIFYNKTTSNAFGPPTLKFNKNYVHLNKEGFRDYDYEIVKGKNTTRIIGLGDSFTYGWGIKNINDSYLKVLEKKLNADGKEKKYEVINFGKGGMYTDDELKILKENALKYKPDILIIGHLPNDHRNIDKEIKEYEWTRIKLPFDLWLRNYLYSYFFLEMQLNNFLENTKNKLSYGDTMLKIFESDVNREYNKQVFEEIANITKENNIKVLIVVFPIMYKFEDYPFIVGHNFIKEVADENNFYLIDLLDVYKKYKDSELILNGYDRHPNEFAHELAAESIYEKLKLENLV